MPAAAEFERLRRLALAVAGISLQPRHRDLLGRRAQRADVGGPHGWTRLLDAVEGGDPEAEQRLIGLVTTRHTAFFRHPEHFASAAASARRAVERRAHVRLWSAGTATGEEAWSLAMTMWETFPAGMPPAEILATDIHEAALAVAEQAEYDDRALHALDPERRLRFVQESADSGRRRLVPELRRLVGFRPLNLAAEPWPVDGPFDVIFCRNVLMYLDAAHRVRVLERLAARLAPDGLLLLDPAEHPGPAGHWFLPRAAGVFARRRSPDPAGPPIVT